MMSFILVEDFMKASFQSIFQQNQTFVLEQSRPRSVISNSYPFPNKEISVLSVLSV